MRSRPALLLVVSLLACLPLARPAFAAPVPLSRLPDPSRARNFDGSADAPVARTATWRQLAFELRAASDAPAQWPDLDALAARVRAARAAGVVPVALLDRAVADAERGGATPARVLAAAAFPERILRGADVAFELDPELFVSDGAPPARLALDPGDGAGFRAVGLGEPVRAHYARTGPAIATVRWTAADGAARIARFALEIAALVTPTPDDTLSITGTVPFRGGVASGTAYVRLGAGHTQLVNPVVIPEGFDLDNSMGWDELFELLDQQGLADTLQARGYDAVVLDFADATDYVERNGFVLVELLRQLRAELAPGASMAVVGPSMGGLVGRFALAWMEAQGEPHRVRTLISFDAPYQGADIPLGLQYWVGFFAGQSADAAFLLGRLDTPAAREMLVYHHTTPPATSPGPDSLRAAMVGDLDAVGWPQDLRRVAVANGSGRGVGQGFAAAAQIIQYDYNILIAHILGNVWAVPDGGSAKIFDGRIQIIFQPTQTLAVTVAGTQPYDNAPGGWRATMLQMDTTAVPYGDIVALYPHHAFIPTVSALDVAGATLFEDLAADPDLLARTPFDAVYAPLDNQEHVSITAENAAWFLDEIQRPALAVPAGAGGVPRALEFAGAAPNPLASGTTLRFRLPRAATVRLRVYGIDGRAVATLVDGPLAAGPHEVRWTARDARGAAVAPGVYFARLQSGRDARTRRIVVLP